jgi:hypothetical protein
VLHPELQHQVANIRTDLDRFSDLEMSGLVRHGYGVMRSVCRSRPDLFGDVLPNDTPWDPAPSLSPATDQKKGKLSASQVTEQARELQASAQRKLFSRLFSFRDWPSYVFVPILAALLFGAPYLMYRAYRRAHRSEMIVDAITFSNPDFQHVLQLARQNPMPGEWTPIEIEEVTTLQPVSSEGFRLITDTRVIDMRSWDPAKAHETHHFVSYRRMQVRRVALPTESEAADFSEGMNKFRLQQFGLSDQVSVRCNAKGLKPVFRLAPFVNETGQEGYLYEIEFDLSSVPEGQDFDIAFEVTDVGLQGRFDDESRLLFPVITATDVATMWVFLPEGRPYRSFKLIAYDSKAPVNVESIEPTYDFRMADGSLLGWMLVAPREGNTYECRWIWQD